MLLKLMMAVILFPGPSRAKAIKCSHLAPEISISRPIQDFPPALFVRK